MKAKNNKFIQRAMKNGSRNADAKKLDRIQNYSSIKWIREETIFDPRFSTANHIRVPDLKCKGEIEILLEHDTYKIHGDLSSPNERTLKRNHDYTITNRPYVVIHEDLCKILKLDESALATYLYWHELARVKVSQMVKEELMY